MQPFCRELQAAGMLDLTNPSWLSKHRDNAQNRVKGQ
jgi:hypothetical protein